MPFSRKLFLSVLVTSALVGSLLIWIAHTYVSRQSEERFRERYAVFTRLLGDTLSSLDVQTEALMLNAAKVVVAKDAERGLLSIDELQTLRDDLKMTHVFVTDATGKFIRSTNEDPALIPNLFSFCSDYRKLITGVSKSEATPVIQPNPEPKPFKFLSVPTRDHKRIIEVGVRVDFIGKTLAEAAASDSNVVTTTLYAPDGSRFGKFGPGQAIFADGRAALPADLRSVDEGGVYRFYSKVRSSHPQCCQCDLAGTSRNGEYYYVLETEVSKAQLVAVQASTRNAFILFGFGNLVLAALLSGFVTSRLVSNIRIAVRKVRAIKEKGDFEQRIGLKGKDEVAFLTNEFDRLLDALQDSQKRIIEAQKSEAKVQLAREVAHNIRSPAVAIEMILPMLGKLPERLKRVLGDSAREIKTLAERLTRQADGPAEESVASEPAPQLVSPVKLLEGVIQEKRIELSKYPGIEIESTIEKNQNGRLVAVDPLELRAIVSNVVNNAVESYPGRRGRVQIGLAESGQKALISITDIGKGIPADVLSKLGEGAITHEKEDGHGLGLLHAYRMVAAWGGDIKIASRLGAGTRVDIALPIQDATRPDQINPPS